MTVQCLCKAVRVNRLQEIIKGCKIECLDCILIMSGCENNTGFQFGKPVHLIDYVKS